MRRKILLLPLIYIFILIFASCEQKFTTISGVIWNTSYHIVYRGNQNLEDSIQHELNRVNAGLSMFEPSSTVSLVNAGATDSVGADFIYVFNESQRISAASGGSFDPTVGPLTELWGFGRNKSDDGDAPDTAAIAEALRAVGIGDCRIDGCRVIKKSPATTFDFSAIAKGYGVDLVAEMLERNGVSDYMVEIGGEVRVAGHPATAEAWRIQIDAPVESADSVVHERLDIITLTHGAVATSGNYRNFRDTEAGRVGHTLDPMTGRPAQRPTLSATVTAPRCLTADALATACMAMEPHEARAMVERLDSCEALLVIARGDSMVTIASSRFGKPYE